MVIRPLSVPQDIAEDLALWDTATPVANGATSTPDVVPFDQPFTLPRFPTRALPVELADYVEAIADELYAAPETVAMSVLAVVSTAMCGRLEVQVKPGWKEPANLFAIAIAESGEKKSQVLGRVNRPLRNAQSALREQTAEKRAAEKVAKEVADARAKNALSSATKNPELLQEAERAQAEADGMVVSAPPLLIADDVTPEALRDLIIEQRGRLGVLAAEGNLVEVIAGRYSDRPSMEYLLKAHSAEPIVVTRVGSGHRECPRAAVTVGLLVQPDVMKAMLAIDGAVERGLVGRFLVVRAPARGKAPWNTPTVPTATEEAYTRTIAALVARFWRAEVPITVEMAPGAQAVLAEFFDEVEERRYDNGDLAVVAPWALKLVGHTARIAAITAAYESRGPATVEERHAAGAVEIARVLAEHFLNAYSLRRDPGQRDLEADARVLQAWYKRKHLKTFTKREACRDIGWPAPRVQAALDELAERGYVDLRAVGHGSVQATVSA